MAVDEPVDVLNDLLTINRAYRGEREWRLSGERYSNPVKVLSDALTAVEAHPSARNVLSGRSGAALIYALSSQRSHFRAGAEFSRVFPHRDGLRRLMLENGVTRDLLAIGAITRAPSGAQHSFSLTGLGAEQLRANFPDLVP